MRLILRFLHFTDHIVTVVLISASYSANLTGIGIAIHATMDVSDILLSVSHLRISSAKTLHTSLLALRMIT